MFASKLILLFWFFPLHAIKKSKELAFASLKEWWASQEKWENVDKKKEKPEADNEIGHDSLLVANLFSQDKIRPHNPLPFHHNAESIIKNQKSKK